MLAFWIIFAIVIIVGEKIKDSYDAYKFNKKGGFDAATNYVWSDKKKK